MEILFSWLSPLRFIFIALDQIAYSFLGSAYNIVIELSSQTLLEHETVETITKSLYILAGVVAFFRLALVLVNSILDPDKLNEKGKGLSNIFFRFVVMFVLLAITPFLFEVSYDITKKLVSSDANKNIIFQLFLGDNSMGGYSSDGEYDAGKALQNVVLSSLITIDRRYLAADGETCRVNNKRQVVDSDGNVKYNSIDDVPTKGGTCGYIPLSCVPNSTDKDENRCTMYGMYVVNDECYGNCIDAVNLYNEMYVSEDMEPYKLSKYVGVSDEIDDTEVYVYNYMLLVTTAAGIFITWVILSFAVDIAVRMFELLALEILSPFFIATFVDPNSAKSGPFKNWLSAVGKSYVSLYIRLFILALFTFFLSIVNEFNLFNDLETSSLARVFIVIGLLVFAKKAPKWISELIGIKGDGVGLWSPKKLKENMLGSSAMAAAVGGAAGFATSGLRNLNNLRRHRSALKKENPDLLTRSGRKKARNQRAKEIMNDKIKQGYVPNTNLQRMAERIAKQEQQQQLKQARKGAHLDAKSTAAQVGSALFNAAGSIKASAKADKLSDSIKTAGERSAAFSKERGLLGETYMDKIKSGLNKVGGSVNDTAFGNPYERQERIDAMTKAKNEIEWHKDGHGINSKKQFGDAIKINGTSAQNEEDALIVMGAKKAGIKASEITYTNDNGENKLTINGNILSDSERQAYFNSIANNLTASGFAHYGEMFNSTQNSAIAEYQNNMQQMQQMSSMMGSLQESISRSIGSLGDKFKDSFKDFTESGLSFNLSDGSLKVALAGDKELKINPENLNDVMSTLRTEDPDKAEYIESNGLLSKLSDFFAGQEYLNYESFSKQYAQSADDYSNYYVRQQQLQPVINGAKYIVDIETGKVKTDSSGNPIFDDSATTLAGIESKLSRETSKIKEKIKFIESKNNDKKDDK